jgi:hypothetical protein
VGVDGKDRFRAILESPEWRQVYDEPPVGSDPESGLLIVRDRKTGELFLTDSVHENGFTIKQQMPDGSEQSQRGRTIHAHYVRKAP